MAASLYAVFDRQCKYLNFHSLRLPRVLLSSSLKEEQEEQEEWPRGGWDFAK